MSGNDDCIGSSASGHVRFWNKELGNGNALRFQAIIGVIPNHPLNGW